MPPRARAFLVLAVLALIGSCVSGDSPTSVGQSLPARLAFQPSVIATPADGDALPVNRIRVVVLRDADGALLADSVFTVQPTDTTWSLDVSVRLQTSPTQARLQVYLLNQASDGTRTVQFSGQTGALALMAGQTASPADVPIVRGPLDNLLVTGVAITSVAPTVVEGQTTTLAAAVTTSSPGATPTVYWTSLDTQVVRMDSSTAFGVAEGTADVVASAGAFADTTTVTVGPAVDSVLVSPDSADVMVGATTTYTAELFDSSGGTLTGRTVTWSTGNASIASVSATGVVTGVAAGTTTVTATSEGVSDAAKVVVVPMPAGTGAQNTWIANGGLWSTPASWSLGRVPIPGDTVFLTQNDDYAVTLDADVTIGRLEIGGTVDLISLYTDGWNLTVTDPGPTPALHIGPLGYIDIPQGTITADVILNEGDFWSRGVASVVSDSVVIAAGAYWTVAHGSGLTLSHPDVPYLLTSGTLTVESGAAMHIAGGHLDYAGGSVAGTGVLYLEPGSDLLLDADLTTEVSLYLDESASVANTADRLVIGPSGFLSMISTAGNQSSVNHILTVQGGMTSAGPESYVNDSLYVEAGANVTVYSGSSLGTVDVVNSGSIDLAGSGVATFGPGGTTNRRILNLASGRLDLQANGTNVIDGELINQGLILIGGPTLLQRENVFGTPVAAQHVNTGTIMVNADFTVELGGLSTTPSFTNQGTINVFATRTLTVSNLSDGVIVNDVTGLLTGLGTVDVTPGGVVGLNYGSIHADHDLTPGGGTMSWIGNVPMAPGGSLDFTLEGTTPGSEHDRLDVTGSLLLDGNGTLVVDTINGFEPSPGDRFAIMTFTGRSGTFADVSLPNIAGALLDTVWAGSTPVDTLYIEATAMPFHLAANGVTVVCTTALVGDAGMVGGQLYTKRSRAQIDALIGAGNFPPLSTTCTSGITDMSSMFDGVTAFNEDISSWDLSDVTTTNSLFKGATSFNRDVSAWDVSGATNMGSMFFTASSFDQDVSGWDVSGATNMDYMFGDALVFNQDLSGWCVSGIPSAPTGFDTGAASWTAPRPIWGTCSPASVVTSTVVASPSGVSADGVSTSTLTVQLKDASGTNLAVSSRTVTFDAPSSGSIGVVTDNGDGTYTATYTAGSVLGTVSVTARLDGVALYTTADIMLGNVLGRWVDVGGTPISSASVGSTVYFQLCYTGSDMAAFQGTLQGFGSYATASSVNDLDSSGAGVHPDCAGSVDVLNNGFTASGTSDPIDALVTSAFATGGTGPAGILWVEFVLTNPGVLQMDVTSMISSDFSGSPLTLGAAIDHLTVN